jgi:23S rRNA (uracil1939-C5)-methyltransferase
MNSPDADVYDIELTTLTYGGEALGRLPDGRAVFVPFALLGELVRLRLVEDKRNYARAELLEVLSPSKQRIQARCIHFGICGGCHYQHMPYADQLDAKRDILKDQLERIGKISDPPAQPTVPSPQHYNYRNYVQFHLTQEGQLGYYEAQAQRVFAIQECHLPEEPLNVVWPQLQFDSIPELERIGLRLGTENDIQLILESSDWQPPEFSVEELPISAVHLSEAGALVLAGSEQIAIEVLERSFRVSAGSFFQVNTTMAAAMINHLLENLAKYVTLQTDSSVVLDVYCGAGLFSAFLAPLVSRLVGVESSPSAVEDFVVNLDEFDNVAIYESLAEQALPQLTLNPDVILVDPPRAGLEKAVLDSILNYFPKVLVYVSCDPATLARDARRLRKGGYRMQEITPFDLFPQTFHIESMSFWTPAA